MSGYDCFAVPFTVLRFTKTAPFRCKYVAKLGIYVEIANGYVIYKC